MTKIAIVDYGMGNIRSVAQAVMKVAPECTVVIAHTPEMIASADKVILPGQGAMPDCMTNLKESGLFDALLVAIKTKPLLGVCVGEQMLFSTSAEAHHPQKNTDCLNIFPGEVIKFALDDQEQANGSHFKVPHMGWNEVKQQRSHPMWEGIPDASRFYFVHSYYVVPDHEEYVFGTTHYGKEFTSAVAKDNIFATQFHPEKSAQLGLCLYKNFTRWNP